MSTTRFQRSLIDIVIVAGLLIIAVLLASILKADELGIIPIPSELQLQIQKAILPTAEKMMEDLHAKEGCWSSTFVVFIQKSEFRIVMRCKDPPAKKEDIWNRFAPFAPNQSCPVSILLISKTSAGNIFTITTDFAGIVLRKQTKN